MSFNEKAWHVGFKWTIGDEDNPTGAICLDDSSDALHICEIRDATTDWAVSTKSHPTLYLHSASDPATDYISMYHDGTSGIITLDGTTILTLTATTLAIAVDTAISGDLDLLTEDISVTTGKYIYLDGASGNDYLRASTDNNVILNGQTTVNLGVAGTTEVAVDGTAVTLATNNLTLTAGEISVAATHYVYLDGQSGSEYVRAVTDGNAMLNSATTTALGIAGTAVITVASATATFAQKIVQDDTTASTAHTDGSIQTDGGLGVAGTAFFNSLVTSTSTTGFATAATFVPDASRTNYAYSIGNRTTELTVNLANAASQNFEPLQMNINFTASAGAPTSTSTARLLRIRSTHDTTDMANLRIMNINTYMDVRKNMEAAYGQMNGVDFQTNAVAITTEAAVGVFNMDAVSAVTGNVRGIIINLHGANLPSTTSIGLEVRTDGGSAVLTEGIRIWSVGGNSLTTGLKMQGTLATCFDFESVVTGCDDTDSEGSRNGRILVVDKNGDTKYILLYDGS